MYNTYYNIGKFLQNQGHIGLHLIHGVYLENSVIHPDDPQLMGKTAYSAHIVHDSVNKYIMKHPNPVIIELGCGTGAGANLIAKYMLPRCKYFLWISHDYRNSKKDYTVIIIYNLFTEMHKYTNKKCVADIIIINETHMAEFENISEEDASI